MGRMKSVHWARLFGRFYLYRYVNLLLYTISIEHFALEHCKCALSLYFHDVELFSTVPLKIDKSIPSKFKCPSFVEYISRIVCRHEKIIRNRQSGHKLLEMEEDNSIRGVVGACTGNPLIYLAGIESLNQFIHLIGDDVLQCSLLNMEEN